MGQARLVSTHTLHGSSWSHLTNLDIIVPINTKLQSPPWRPYGNTGMHGGPGVNAPFARWGPTMECWQYVFICFLSFSTEYSSGRIKLHEVEQNHTARKVSEKCLFNDVTIGAPKRRQPFEDEMRISCHNSNTAYHAGVVQVEYPANIARDLSCEFDPKICKSNCHWVWFWTPVLVLDPSLTWTQAAHVQGRNHCIQLKDWVIDGSCTPMAQQRHATQVMLGG